MRTMLRVMVVGLLIVGTAGGVVWYLTRNEPGTSSGRFGVPRTRLDEERRAAGDERSDPGIPLYSDNFIDDSGHDLAFKYSAPVTTRGELELCYRSAEGRGDRGRADVLAALGQFERAAKRPPDYAKRRATLQAFVGLLYAYEGRFEDADPWFERAAADNPGIPRELRLNLVALRGVAALRRGEIDNCVACLGPSTCIFPIAPEAVHQSQAGSRAAVRWFTEYLGQRPDDLGVRWLLNIAYMTLGEYPEKVPGAWRMPLASFRSSKLDVGRWVNVAQKARVSTRGPNMLGGAVFDDFTGDGRPDVMVVSGEWDRGGSLFVNRGDGTFEDMGTSAGLADQRMAVNLTHADFDNDGRLDALLLRGGWETPYRLTLLRNKGNGAFEDVTVAAGMAEPIASQSGAWADYDGDGLVDLYVAGEYHHRNATPVDLGRLYHNLGNGRFENVAARAGVENARWAKGAAWGDYDGDGDPDLYVSNMNDVDRLYRNDGDGTFTDVAVDLGVTGPERSFSCWFWDFDNDGRLDLFVSAFSASLLDVVSDSLGHAAKGERPRLYRNLGPEGFKDVTEEVGLDRVLLPMGSNFADVDNDGFLDVYLATGEPSYSALVPNVMFKNVDGKGFEDVTISSGTGHLQKGHAVSFADMDGDGDLDLFVEMGGQTPGDKAHNALFLNPGHGRHWLQVKLVGTRSNRAAIGAKVRAELVRPDGTTRTIHRVVGAGSSFGGNSLVVSLGLGEATAVKTVSITWPTGGTVQTFSGVPGDRAIEVVEGSDTYRSSVP